MGQGCVVGPTLFNLVFDDVFLISESVVDAQERLDAFNREVQRAGMEISLTKNEVMVVNSDGPSDIILNDAKIKEVRSFIYLGSALNVEGEISEAVSNNCREARTEFAK